jgi:hypothetical protein
MFRVTGTTLSEAARQSHGDQLRFRLTPYGTGDLQTEYVETVRQPRSYFFVQVQ